MAKLLIVDDDHDILALLGILFGKSGIDCFTLDDASMVEEWVRKETPAMVLMDIYMPPFDGRKICLKLKQQHPELTVLLCSANLIPNDTISSSMADGFIAKPYDIYALVDLVRKKLLTIQLKQNHMEMPLNFHAV